MIDINRMISSYEIKVRISNSIKCLHLVKMSDLIKEMEKDGKHINRIVEPTNISSMFTNYLPKNNVTYVSVPMENNDTENMMNAIIDAFEVALIEGNGIVLLNDMETI